MCVVLLFFVVFFLGQMTSFLLIMISFRGAALQNRYRIIFLAFDILHAYIIAFRICCL